MATWTLLDDLLHRSIDRGELAGAVTRVWHRGREAHRSALGLADVTSGRAMTDDTLFRLYSLSKPITAVAMMMLWDEGRWSPDDPVTDHLPELAGLQVMDGSGNRRPAARPPTIEELMTNRAGFTYGLTPDPIDDAFRAAGVPSFPRALTGSDYLRRLADAPLAYEPGESWRYSAAMDVQGLLVERLSGKPLDVFLEERLFGPLRMTDTAFRLKPADRPRLARLYAPAADGIVAVDLPHIAPDYEEAPLMASGGAGLLSTAADYARFGRMLLEGGILEGRRVLSEAAVAMMTRSHTPTHCLDRDLGVGPHRLRPGYEYAYNGVVVTDPARAAVALGTGTYLWDGAASTWFWVDPENELVFVCMVQLLAEADGLSLQFQSRPIVADILQAATSVVFA